MASGSTVAGRIYLVVIGMGLALVGGLFCWLMWRSFNRAHQMRAWPQVPCLILSSGVEERRHDPNSPVEYRFAVEYGYEWENEAYVSNHWTWRSSPWSSDREKAEQTLSAYPEGSRSTCYVNPKEPSFAILRPDSEASGYSIWFPALFVVGGLGIAVNGCIGKRRSEIRRDVTTPD